MGIVALAQATGNAGQECPLGVDMGSEMCYTMHNILGAGVPGIGTCEQGPTQDETAMESGHLAERGGG